MLELLKRHLDNSFPFLSGKKLFLAVSGGVDSIVLLHLFQQLPYEIGIGHCNFQLRGVASFEDQHFVETYAERHQIPFFCTQFDTQAFATDYKMSIQVAARTLRYHWFEEQMELHQYDYLLTAHHADDNLETFIINLSRGTGLDGLSGIPMQNENIIRPLLLFSRAEIEEYAATNALKWREDESNASDKYLRNNIRHHVVPLLKTLSTDFLASFAQTQTYLQEAKSLIDDAAVMVYQQVAREEQEAVYFDIPKLLKLPNYSAYLYQWLKDFGFTAWEDIYALVYSSSGRQVFAKDFRLIKDRDHLILSPLEALSSTAYYIDVTQLEVKIPLKLLFSTVENSDQSDANTIFVDANLLKYPLVLRKWKEGDSFYPYGMQGKRKKVSKYFKDEKMSLLDKENTWLLCSQEEILWIVGKRADERFKVNNNTTTILKIDYHS